MDFGCEHPGLAGCLLCVNEWLQNFAYRTDIEIWTFVVSAVMALAIALLTVSYQSVKAALANPVEALNILLLRKTLYF